MVPSLSRTADGVRIDRPVIQLVWPFAKEDVQAGAGEGSAGDGKVAVDLKEVAEVKVEVLREDTEGRGAELHRDLSATHCELGIDRSSGGVDSDSDADASAESSTLELQHGR